MRRARSGILVVLGLLLAGPPPRAAAEDAALRAAVEAAAAGAPDGTTLAVRVETPQGEVLCSLHGEEPLVPASNMKLLTAAAALELLGPGFVHETRLVAVGRREGDALVGDLWIVGGGDPTISRRCDKDPLLDELAAAVAATGIRRVTGDLVFDARAFDDERLHPSWEPSDHEHWYGAEVAALALNDDCVDVTVRGGAEGPQVSLEPQSEHVKLEVEARPTGDKRQHRFALVRTGADKRTLRLTGRVWQKAGAYTTSVPVSDPSRFFAAVLQARLSARGVALAGQLRPARAGEACAGGAALWERKAPLPRTLQVMNHVSQNFYAECLLKTLGRRDAQGQLTQQGTWKRGAAVSQAFARERCGVPAGEVTVSDGSGLSRDDRLSARALVAVLRRALGGEHARVYWDSLARPGEEGTLRRRLQELPPGVELRAKTGTLTGVAALSGAIEKGGRRWLFSLIMNGKGTSRRYLDRVALALAKRL
ncbi:MAG: D-alanyl-D-alanine carboxypeptidase/D-alanyl-D-alanine-endopeptidase [Planctomycetota bacterium]